MKKIYNDFDLTLEECRDILNNIDGLVVTDKDGNIRYMTNHMREKLSKIDSETFPHQVVGKNIREVYPGSKIIDFLGSEKSSEYCIYLGMSTLNISRVKSFETKNGDRNILDMDLFSTVDDFKEFYDKIASLINSGRLDMPSRINFEMLDKKDLKSTKYSVSDIIGKSVPITNLKKMLIKISESDSTVLIEAETGCGKELVAQSIHNTSRRMNSPMIEINCAAIPENLFESELFGYEEGSFTGAKKGGKAGKFELAEKGTLFLDEVDQLPYHVQSKLLRVLQENEFARIGGKTKKMDVRIIAASNKNLADLVKEGKFREDLYYRLNIIRIAIPPLRKRPEDIPLLVDKFIDEMNEKLDKHVKGVSSQVMRVMYNYRWKGNVRELKNIVERAMNICEGRLIELEDLGDSLFDSLGDDISDDILNVENPLERAREMAECEVIMKALELCGGNKQKTAELLKISRATLYNKISNIPRVSKKIDDV